MLCEDSLPRGGRLDPLPKDDTPQDQFLRYVEGDPPTLVTHAGLASPIGADPGTENNSAYG